MGKITTRMGDGSFVELTESELKQDLEDGARDAAERGNVPMLTDDDLRYLYEVFASPYKFVSVEPGNECCLSYDAGTLKVLGGIIQNARGPVGTFNSSTGEMITGYSKNYTYDPRLASNPPPYYPTTGQYERLSWRTLAN